MAAWGLSFMVRVSVRFRGTRAQTETRAFSCGERATPAAGLVRCQARFASSRRRHRRGWRGRRAQGMLVARSSPSAAPGAARPRRTGRRLSDGASFAAHKRPAAGSCAARMESLSPALHDAQRELLGGEGRAQSRSGGVGVNLARLVIESGARRPEGVAVRLDDAGLSYRGLDRASARVAALLRGRGLEPGDRVGLMLPNVVEFAVVYYGILRAGGAVVPMNTMFRPREIGFMLA